MEKKRRPICEPYQALRDPGTPKKTLQETLNHQLQHFKKVSKYWKEKGGDHIPSRLTTAGVGMLHGGGRRGSKSKNRASIGGEMEMGEKKREKPP